MENGSSKSEILQKNAVATAEAVAPFGAAPMGMWIRGTEMVALAVDGQSREGAIAVHAMN